MTASTRRAALGAILAAPLASAPALAAPPVPEAEALFLSIGPRLVAALDEFHRLWPAGDEPYKAWQFAHLTGPDGRDRQDLPEWHAYLAARAPADRWAEEAQRLYEPFMDIPLSTLPAILLRHRYGMAFEVFREDVLKDMDRLWGRTPLCV